MWADILEIILNIIEAITLIVSLAGILYLMLNKFTHGLRAIFLPCGMHAGARLWVLFLCRKSYKKKRIFIEYALLKSQGKHLSRSEWRAIINSFKSFYVEDKEGLVYKLPNCTSLSDDDLNKAIKRYFDFLNEKKVKKAFGLQDTEGIGWLLKVRITEAYITPTCLLAGLLSQYGENWEEVIKKYVSTAYATESNKQESSKVLERELYFTLTWLLWGPSYELEYKNNWAGLCQMSYGDENISIPAIVDNTKTVIDELKKKLEENITKGNRYGALVSADVTLFEKNEYFDNLRDFENPKNSYFYDRIEHSEYSFIAQIDDFEAYEGYRAKKYYCTAYVWLLFELDDEDAAESVFHPEKTVAFFEHTNLADKDTYTFLVDALIEKSINHFKNVFTTESGKDRKYHFVTSLNESVEKRCKERYEQFAVTDKEFGEKFANQISFAPKYTPATVFSAFDSYFVRSNGFDFVTVSLDDKQSITDLGEFYTSIYIDEFKNVNERESLDNILYYLNQSKNDNRDCVYNILLVKDNDKVVGGAIFDYFKRTNVGMGEFIVIKSDQQSSGIGTELFIKMQGVLKSQAIKNGHEDIDYLFCEIEAPKKDAPVVEKHVAYWHRRGFRKLNFNYIQPALSLGKESVTSLWLLALSKDKSISTDIVKNVLYDYMKYCMQIDNPEDNDEFKAMAAELAGRAEIELSPIKE